MATKRILAIDGGGIRGLIPALVLVKVEELTGKRIAKLFDLIAGTSTGGILAAGLCVPGGSGGGPKYQARDLVALYKEHGAEIFGNNLLRKVVSLVYGAEYSPQNLEAYLKEKLGAARLADAVTGLLITSYDMREGEAWFFSRAVAQQKKDHNYLLWEVARATSAAPTYFPPFRMPKAEGATLVDGGVFANNPVMCAWVDAHEGINASPDSMILSLGTGSVPHPVTYDRARVWGKVRWAQPAIGAFMDGQSDTADYQLSRLVAPANYLRLQVKLSVEHEKMDNASARNLEALERAAHKMLEENSRRLSDFCQRVMEGPAPAGVPVGLRS